MLADIFIIIYNIYVCMCSLSIIIHIYILYIEYIHMLLHPNKFKFLVTGHLGYDFLVKYVSSKDLDP